MIICTLWQNFKIPYDGRTVLKKLLLSIIYDFWCIFVHNLLFCVFLYNLLKCLVSFSSVFWSANNVDLGVSGNPGFWFSGTADLMALFPAVYFLVPTQATGGVDGPEME